MSASRTESEISARIHIQYLFYSTAIYARSTYDRLTYQVIILPGWRVLIRRILAQAFAQPGDHTYTAARAIKWRACNYTWPPFDGPPAPRLALLASVGHLLATATAFFTRGCARLYGAPIPDP